MKRLSLLALAAAMAVGGAAPAFADWDRLGTVTVTAREGARVYSRFGGPVERLYFDADRSDVYCRSIRVTFANGRVRNIFSGRLGESNPRIIDLPGYQRSVRRIDLRCRALERRTANIQIAADIGRYRDTWRRNPNFERLWGALFNWDDDDRYARDDRGGRDDRRGRDDDNDNRWVRLGSERFDGRETESTFAGFRGRSLEAIGIQAVDDDARCRSLRVHFANGRSRSVNFGGRMDEDRIYRVDLPGDERNVTRVDLDCRPVGDDDVTVNIYGIG